MHFSLLKLVTVLGLASLAVSIPLTKRDHHDCGDLSDKRPSRSAGKFGDYKDFKLKGANDINILQFALMLEVFLSRTTG
jgi:hypothetical protein